MAKMMSILNKILYSTYTYIAFKSDGGILMRLLNGDIDPKQKEKTKHKL